MTSKGRIALPLLILLSGAGGAVHGQAGSGVDLVVERVSLYVGPPHPQQDVTLSVRVRNAGSNPVSSPFRTSLFPGAVTGGALSAYFVTTPELGAGETVFMSRTITLPPGVHEFDARVEADVDQVTGDADTASNVGSRHFADPAVLPAEAGHWISAGPRQMRATIGSRSYETAGRLAALAVHPQNPQVIYVGSPGAEGVGGTGVWKTSDGGQSWQPVTESLPTVTVAAIAIDPSTSPERVYVVTNDAGLFRSDDAGTSWVNVHGDLGVHHDIGGDWTHLLLKPSSPNVLYLTTTSGVQRSDDFGRNWKPSLKLGQATHLVMDPRDDQVLYAAIQGVGIYRTGDGGESWVPQAVGPADYSPTYGIPLGISHPAADAAETVYALLGSVTVPLGYSLFRTTTGGASWDSSPRWGCGMLDPKTGLNGDGDCNFSVMAVDPGDITRVYFGGPILRVARAGSDATVFDRVPPVGNDLLPDSPHGDWHGLAVNPFDTAVVFAATDGGFYASSDHAATGSWAFKGDDITAGELYDVALAASGPDRMIGGTQDIGPISYTGSPLWEKLGFALTPTDCCDGDIGVVAIDPADASTSYVTGFYQQNLWRRHGLGPWQPFTQGLPTFDKVKQGDCATYNGTFHFQVHPTVTTTLFASCGSVYRTTTNVPPGQWTPIFPPPVAGEIVARTAVDAAGDLVYAGTNRGRLYRGPATGLGTWSEVFGHPGGLHVTDIEVAGGGSAVYATFSSPTGVGRHCDADTGGRIYRLTPADPLAPPGGALVSADLTGDLPAGLCVNAVMTDPHLPRTLYAATGKGVYRGRGNATGAAWRWEEFANGLPPADVRDLEIQATTGRMFAATFGRGVFQVTTPASLDVGIDIKPGTYPNPINVKSNGKIPVAILSSATFDAPAEVDRLTLTFGRTGDEASLDHCNPEAEDVNGDGLADVVCHFSTPLAGFQVGDTSGVLKGMTLDGAHFEGSDTVRTVP